MLPLAVVFFATISAGTNGQNYTVPPVVIDVIDVPQPALNTTLPTNITTIVNTTDYMPPLDPLATYVDPEQYGSRAIFLHDGVELPPIVNDTLVTPLPRIANGNDAARDAYPFAAALSISGNHACGAALIAPRVILTAAHCVYNYDYNEFFRMSSMAFRIGDVNRNSGIQRRPRGIVIPDTFKPNRNYYGDIALILLDDPVDKRPVKLVTKQKVAKEYRVIGWGKTESGFLSPTLQQADLRGMNRATCQKVHKENKLGDLPKDHFCSGLNSSGADTCTGDSGGPVLSGEYQVGITSYGSPNAKCGSGENFGLYTSVAYWNTWIQDSLSVYNMKGKSKPWKFNKPQFNVCYEGGTYKRKKTSSMGQCCEACRVGKGCAAWSWVKSTKTCVFKHRDNFQATKSTKCHSGRFY